MNNKFVWDLLVNYLLEKKFSFGCKLGWLLGFFVSEELVIIVDFLSVYCCLFYNIMFLLRSFLFLV